MLFRTGALFWTCELVRQTDLPANTIFRDCRSVFLRVGRKNKINSFVWEGYEEAETTCDQPGDEDPQKVGTSYNSFGVPILIRRNNVSIFCAWARKGSYRTPWGLFLFNYLLKKRARYFFILYRTGIWDRETYRLGESALPEYPPWPSRDACMVLRALCCESRDSESSHRWVSLEECEACPRCPAGLWGVLISLIYTSKG